jgi:hypothetical protein
MMLGLVATIRAEGTTGTVNGSVVGSDGKAVPNIKVRFKKVLTRAPAGKTADGKSTPEGQAVASVTTDKDGKFSQALEAGDYWAEAGNKTVGYAKDRISVKAGESTDLKLTLTKDEGK